MTPDWMVVWEHRERFLEGAAMTIFLTVATMALAIPGGLALAFGLTRGGDDAAPPPAQPARAATIDGEAAASRMGNKIIARAWRGSGPRGKRLLGGGRRDALVDRAAKRQRAESHCRPHQRQGQAEPGRRGAPTGPGGRASGPRTSGRSCRIAAYGRCPSFP